MIKGWETDVFFGPLIFSRHAIVGPSCPRLPDPLAAPLHSVPALEHRKPEHGEEEALEEGGEPHVGGHGPGDGACKGS